MNGINFVSNEISMLNNLEKLIFRRIRLYCAFKSIFIGLPVFSRFRFMHNRLQRTRLRYETSLKWNRTLFRLKTVFYRFSGFLSVWIFVAPTSKYSITHAHKQSSWTFLSITNRLLSAFQFFIGFDYTDVSDSKSSYSITPEYRFSVCCKNVIYLLPISAEIGKG